MKTRLCQIVLAAALSALGGCVAEPPPMEVAQQNCQQFTQTIIVNGVSQLGYGLQCLQPDGSWQIVAPAGPTPPVLPPPTVAVPYAAYPAYPAYVPYAYDPYYYGSPWYFGPEIGIGIGVGRGGEGGWHGGGGGWRR